MTVKKANTSNYICSPLSYIGGKYKLLPQIIPLLPKDVNVFVDLFCGGCNVGINAFAQKVIFNDNLTFLIDLYNVLSEQPIDQTLNYITSRIEQYGLSLTNKIGYLDLRTKYNLERNPLDLFVLIAYSFNHQIRFNNSHEFNNPFGKNRSCFNVRMKNNLEAFLTKLQKMEFEFMSSNFIDFDFSCLTKSDFVYCDPPYLITTGTYNDGKRGFTGWSSNEEIALLDILNDLNERGVRFALSNVLTHKGKSNVLLSDWALENSYNIIHLKKSYANSNYQTSRRENDRTDEVLITNY